MPKLKNKVFSEETISIGKLVKKCINLYILLLIVLVHECIDRRLDLFE